MYVLFLALRFLRSRLVNLIAVGGVCVGVAVLIVVTSVMDGFRLKVLDAIRGNLSDVIMTPMMGPDVKLPAFAELDRQIREDARVEAAAPRLEHQVFYLWRSDSRGVLRVGDYAVTPLVAVGIDWEREGDVAAIREYVVAANKEEDPFFSQRKIDYYKQGTVMISRTFAQNFLGVTVGRLHLPRDPDIVQRYGDFLDMEAEEGEDLESYAQRVEAAYAEAHNPFQLILETDVGITFATAEAAGDPNAAGGKLQAGWSTLQLPIAAVYDGQDTSMDVRRVYFDIDNLRDMADLQDEYHTIRVKLKDPADAMDVREALANRFPDYAVTVWQQHRADFLKAVNNEKVLLAIVLSFIVLLGGFTILATLTLTVVEKTKDIGVISALGATRGGVRGLFVGNALLIGTLGALLGVGLGRLVVDNANVIKDKLSEWFGIDIFPPEIYLFREIPTVWDWQGILWIVSGSIITAFVAGMIPAWRASRMDPVKALRYE